MALFQVTKKVREKYPDLNFYGVKVENLKVTQKLLYVKARKKKIQRDFREMYTPENLKEAPQVKAIRDLFVAMGADPEIARGSSAGSGLLLASTTAWMIGERWGEWGEFQQSYLQDWESALRSALSLLT